MRFDPRLVLATLLCLDFTTVAAEPAPVSAVDSVAITVSDAERPR